MWIVCITSVRHVLTVNGYGGRQTKENEKSWCFKGWETLVISYIQTKYSAVQPTLTIPYTIFFLFFHVDNSRIIKTQVLQWINQKQQLMP